VVTSAKDSSSWTTQQASSGYDSTARIDELRTFEREYRTRLKTYLESQLEELGQRGSAAPVDSTANNDGGGAFNQFNRGNN
jgi:hypothetical protein